MLEFKEALAIAEGECPNGWKTCGYSGPIDGCWVFFYRYDSTDTLPPPGMGSPTYITADGTARSVYYFDKDDAEVLDAFSDISLL